MITFLHEQNMLLERPHAFARSLALAGIHDLGHTLEWWCAEWFQRLPLPTGQVPVRHGVVLNELLREGDVGDIDVLALLDGALVPVECRSSPLQVDAITLQR